jgi:hypothetical protein
MGIMQRIYITLPAEYGQIGLNILPFLPINILMDEAVISRGLA